LPPFENWTSGIIPELAHADFDLNQKAYRVFRKYNSSTNPEQRTVDSFGLLI
jgi:hypothetical protein